MNAQGRHAVVLQLAKAEAALRVQWPRRNLHLPPERVTSALLAQRNNTRAAIRWYLGEIRLLRLRIPGLTVAALGRHASAPMRCAAPGLPVQIWTRAVPTGTSTVVRASWFPVPAEVGANGPSGGERPSAD